MVSLFLTVNQIVNTSSIYSRKILPTFVEGYQYVLLCLPFHGSPLILYSAERQSRAYKHDMWCLAGQQCRCLFCCNRTLDRRDGWHAVGRAVCSLWVYTAQLLAWWSTTGPRTFQDFTALRYWNKSEFFVVYFQGCYGSLTGLQVGWITCDNASNNITMLQHFEVLLNASKAGKARIKKWSWKTAHIR